MSTFSSPSVIDLSRLPAPTAIEPIAFEALLQGFVDRFKAYWDELRLSNPLLPAYDVDRLQYDPVIVLGRAWSYIRMLDRQRVNDGLKALLAPLSSGTNLQALVAGRNIERMVAAPATENSPAVMEADTALLRRYLLSLDRASAGSANRYLFDAWAAWPQSEDRTLGLWDARVNGFDVHGRRGDDDIVIIGPFGRLPTEDERLEIRTAVTQPSGKANAISVAVLPATRAEYAVSLVVELPAGPDPSVVVAEAEARVRAACIERTLIGGEIRAGLITGAAYGPSVIKVRDLSPVVIEPHPYTVPVLGDVSIVPEIRA